MKTTIKIAILAILSMTMTVSCKKEPGPNGKKEIHGTVTYTGGTAAGAIVSIKYDATDGSANAFDATATADASGHYEFTDMAKGDYYIDATYTDQYGLEYNSAGVHVLIDKKKGEVAVDIACE